MERVTAICNECQKITDIEYQERYHAKGIKEVYFKCEHCYQHYTAFVTDIKVRKMQRKKDSFKGLHFATKRLEMQKDINLRMAQLKYNLIQFGRADL